VRESVNVFYYPDAMCDHATLKKAILFFDEIHFMDRPAWTFIFPGKSTFGVIGSDSPLRQWEVELRERGVPLYVHDAPEGGPVDEEFYQKIAADINDRDFLRIFQDGIRKPTTARNPLIEHGSFGRWQDADVVRLIGGADLDGALRPYASPAELFEDGTVSSFDFSNPVAAAKKLVFEAATCSAKMNVALDTLAVEGFIPLSDAILHGDLLGTKQRRAAAIIARQSSEIQLTDLSFAVFDELVDSERLQKMSIRDVVEYRKESAVARDAFLEHLSVLQAKHGAVSDDYAGDISRLVNAEIIPAARVFRNRIAGTDDALYGAVIKAAGTLLSGSALKVFTGLSWPQILGLVGIAGSFAVRTLVDDQLAARAARREFAVSYVLSLD
jgi:predicted RNA-binding protein with EMAP domain